MSANNSPRKAKAPQRQPQGPQKTTHDSDSNCSVLKGKQNFPIVRIGKKRCDAIRAEIAAAGLTLDSAQGDCQLNTLPKVMRYFGARGLATVEAEALGYRRIATRIQDLEAAGFQFHVAREHVITDDQLLHQRMARYHLLHDPVGESANSAPGAELPKNSNQLALGL